MRKSLLSTHLIAIEVTPTDQRCAFTLPEDFLSVVVR